MQASHVVAAGFTLMTATARAQTPTPLPWLPPPEAAPATLPPSPATATLFQGLSLEAWYEHFDYDQGRAGGHGSAGGDDARLVIDDRRTLALAPWLGLHFSDRFDETGLIDGPSFGESSATSHGAVNSLREAYVAVRLADGASPLFFDAGRINVREGVGSGYNPTDYFKTDAVLSSTSFDPAALREDRLGVAAVQVQQIAPWGAWSVTLAPPLAAPISPAALQSRNAPFTLGLNRTNGEGAALLKLSPQISQAFSADMLVFAERGHAVQLGLDLSALLSNALVGNIEVSAGRQALLPGPDSSTQRDGWTARSAVNITWTTPQGVDLTVENILVGDGLNAGQAAAWSRAHAAAARRRYASLVEDRSAAQEPLGRVGAFARIGWRDAFAHSGLSLAAFVLADCTDGSLLWQASASQSFGQWTVGATGGAFEGPAVSEFGSNPLRVYFTTHVSRSF
jgi:hypothetical protein